MRLTQCLTAGLVTVLFLPALGLTAPLMGMLAFSLCDAAIGCTADDE